MAWRESIPLVTAFRACGCSRGFRTVHRSVGLYDRDCKFYSPDPTDPAKTNRVLTILLADEY